MTFEPISSLAATTVFLALPFLAKLPDPESSESIGWLVMALAALLVIIKNASDLVRSWFFKDPPDHDRYAKKEELAAVKAEAAKATLQAHDHAAASVAAVEKRFSEWLTGVDHKLDMHVKSSSESREETERALGRIEGKLDAMRNKR
jgi:hypothetical protein